MTYALNRRSARLLAIVAMLFPLLTLGSCGQKGPLYLPGNPSEIKTEVPKQESVQESGQETGQESVQESGQEMPAGEQQDDDEDTEEQPE